MTSRKPYYRYLIVPLYVQIIIIASCLLMLMVQIAIYETLDTPVVVATDQCEVTIGPTNDQGELLRQGATMTCGGEQIEMAQYESIYLFYALTYGREPVIMCDKRETNFLKIESYECKVIND